MTAINQRIFGLDLWRSIAMTIVLVAHGLIATVPYGSLHWMMGGLGVDLFFVLSGYLIGRILIRLLDPVPTLERLRYFYRRRWLRTLPNYYLFLGLNYFFYSAMPAEPLTSRHIAQYATFSANVFSLSGLSFYGVSWSLAVEEWFYVLFPGLVFLLVILRKSFDRAFLTATVVMILLPFVGRCVTFLTDDLAYYSGSYYGWECYRPLVAFRVDTIMFGVLAAYVHHRFPVLWERYRIHAFWSGAMLLGLLLAFFYYYLGIVQLQRSFFFRTIYLSAISVALALMLPRASLVASHRSRLVTIVVTKIAAWSYLIYLSQEILIQVFQPLHLGIPHEDLTAGEVIWFLGIVTLTLMVSAFLYERFEVPFSELGRSSADPSALATPAGTGTEEKRGLSTATGAGNQ